jgi:hypothetical protein
LSSSTLDQLPASLVTTPLSTGDIVGRALRIFRVNIKLIAKVLLAPTIILCIARVGISLGASTLAKGGALSAASGAWAAIMLVSFVVLFIGAVSLYLRELALVRIFCGYADNFESAYKFVRSKLWSLLGVGLIMIFAFVVIAVFWGLEMVVSAIFLPMKGAMPIVGGLLMSFGAVALVLSLLFTSVVAMMAISSMAIEDADIGSLITHCFSLSRRAFARSMLFLILGHVTVSLLAYPLCVPIFLVLGVAMFMQGISAAPHHAVELPLYYQVFSQVWETLISMILGPINYICYGLFYCDLRMRQEGTDLLSRLNSLQAAQGTIE